MQEVDKMSSCRCGDINKCKFDRARLEKAREFIEGYDTRFEMIAIGLRTLAEDCRSAFEANSIDDLCSMLGFLDNDLIDEKNSLLKKIDDKIQNLTDDLDDMEDEDDDYHEQERLDALKNSTSDSTSNL